MQRTIKLRYYPSKKEIKKLNNYFGCCRKIYNVLHDLEKCTNIKNLKIEEKIDKKLVLAMKDYKYEISDIESKIKTTKVNNFTYVRDNYVTYLPQKQEYNYMKE